MVNGKLDSQLQVDEHRCSKKRLSHVCFACCMFFLSFFLAFGCWINFGFGTRGKTGAWAPDIVAERTPNKRPQMLHSVPVGGNNYGDQGEKGILFVKKLHFFLHFRENP